MRIEVYLCLLSLVALQACSESEAPSLAAAAQSTSRTSAVDTPERIPVPAAEPARKEGGGVKAATKVVHREADADIQIGIYNARITDHTVLLGGQPSEEQFSTAADKGYRLIVSLRGKGEPGTSGEKGLVEGLGMRFLQIPLANGNGYNEKNARALAAVLDDPDNRPLMVHCGSGNRVGGLFALEAFFVDGAEPEAALEIGRKAGMRPNLESRVRAAMH